METVIGIGLLVAIVVISILVQKAKAAARKGINRAIRRGTVAREKELTGEVLTATVDRIFIDAVFHAMDAALTFHRGSLPVIGGVFHYVSHGSEGLQFAFGGRLGRSFTSAVLLHDREDGKTDVTYTVSEWTQVDGVSEGTKMMESARSAFIHVAASLPGAQTITRTKDGVETTVWSSHATPGVTPTDLDGTLAGTGTLPASDGSSLSDLVDDASAAIDADLAAGWIANEGAAEAAAPPAPVTVPTASVVAPPPVAPTPATVSSPVAPIIAPIPGAVPVQPPVLVAGEDDELDSTRLAPRQVTMLQWDDGAQTSLAEPIAVGRNPSAPSGVLRTASISDSTYSLSKTHFVVSTEGGALMVTDLHSTNGVVLERGGVRRTLEAGLAAPLAVGDRLVIGERSCEVARQA